MLEQRSIVLIAEDDPDDQLLAREAIDELDLPVDLRMVNDGEEALDYLLHRGSFSTLGAEDDPDLLILDLNMPRIDGRSLLYEVSMHHREIEVPMVVLSTSDSDWDRKLCSRGNAKGFYSKPNSFRELVDVLEEIFERFLD